MVDYKVENDIPIPKKQSLLPIITTLDIGQSVSLPLEKRNTIQSMVSVIKRERGWEFTVKKVSDTSIRVWRVR